MNNQKTARQTTISACQSSLLSVLFMFGTAGAEDGICTIILLFLVLFTLPFDNNRYLPPKNIMTLQTVLKKQEALIIHIQFSPFVFLLEFFKTERGNKKQYKMSPKLLPVKCFSLPPHICTKKNRSGMFGQGILLLLFLS